MPEFLAGLGVIRFRFLLQAVTCVALGVALAIRQVGSQIALWDVLAVLIGAIAAHAAVNALNEYADFRSGLDQQTRRTAFSGGSGTLPAQPGLAPVALWLGIGSLALCAASGAWLLWRDPTLALRLGPLGLLGLLLVVAYTPWVTRRPWLCLVAPGLGFGPLMVLGTQLALAGRVDATGLALSLVPFALCNNLLLLNQFPDIEADRRVGRRTLPMVLGCARCVRLLWLQWFATYLLLVAVVMAGVAPMAVLLGCATLPLAVRAGWVLRGEPCRERALLPAMGLNVAISVTTPLLVAIGLSLG